MIPCVSLFSTYKILHKQKIAVPEQIQLIGFDDIHLASLMSPELTTIHQSVRQLADTAMEILLRSRREEKNGTRHVLPVKLIQRETTSA